jgi:alpha-D-ribose 1-methylphosphonate 5-triphosphate diphosphatase PhnM
MGNVISANNISDENIIEIVKDIYTEATLLFAAFVKAKPDNDDLLMAMSSLSEDVRKQL